MPPKPKYSKEEIIQMAYKMARENGIESVAARELGRRLGTSATPIFTHFKSIQEVKLEVRELAMKELEEYVKGVLEYSPAFKQFGIQLVRFAKEEPKLFQILYMQEHEESRCYDDMFREMKDSEKMCVSLIQKDYQLTRDEAYLVFRQAWINTFSICVLEANKICCFSEEEISEILSVEFQGTLMLVKSGKCKVVPVKRKKLKTESGRTGERK